MFIVEWYDEEGNRNEKTFDHREDAQQEADRLGKNFGQPAIIEEFEV